MLNWAGLGVILNTLIGAIAGGCAAAAGKAPVWEIVLFSLGGLVLGAAMGGVSSTIAHKVLDLSIRRSKASRPAAALLLFLAYMMIPLVSIFIVAFGMMSLAKWLR